MMQREPDQKLQKKQTENSVEMDKTFLVGTILVIYLSRYGLSSAQCHPLENHFITIVHLYGLENITIKCQA